MDKRQQRHFIVHGFGVQGIVDQSTGFWEHVVKRNAGKRGKRGLKRRKLIKMISPQIPQIFCHIHKICGICGIRGEKNPLEAGAKLLLPII